MLKAIINILSPAKILDFLAPKISWLYYIGGLIALVFFIELLTGFLLLPHYEPDIYGAFQSIQYINNYVPHGYFVHNLHAWASEFLIFLVPLYLIVFFAMKLYEKQHIFVWLTGIFLLVVVLCFGLTGALLPWDQLAVNGTQVRFGIVQSSTIFLPDPLMSLGGTIADILRGGPLVSRNTLSRSFSFHVVLLLFAFFVLAIIHLSLINLHGLDKETAKEDKHNRFFPNFFVQDPGVWLFFVFILFLLAKTLPCNSFYSYPLKAIYADNTPTPSGVKACWYFYFLYYPYNHLPKSLVIICVFATFAIMLFAPFVFKKMSISIHRIVSLIVLFYLFVITVWGEEVIHFFKH